MNPKTNTIRFFLALCFALFWNTESKATHILGGQVTYECQGNGQFIFTVKIYTDCSQNVTLQVGLPLYILGSSLPTVNGLAGANQIALPDINTVVNEVTPVCDVSGPALSCSVPTPLQGSVLEHVYRTDPVTLDGTIPADGWTFVFLVNFRSTTMSNLNTSVVGSKPMFLYTSMYGFNGQVPNPCYDSSPQMLATPLKIVCVGNPIDYSMVASDPDADSVAYEFAEPLYGDYQPDVFNPGVYPSIYPYSTGYSYTNPMPDVSFDPLNQPAVLDASTGNIHFENHTLGTYILAMATKSYRCGQLLSKVYREFNIFMTNGCQNNVRPVVSLVTPPTQTIVINTPSNLSIEANPGDIVTFTVGAADNGTLTNGNPQSVSYNAFGGEFSPSFSSAITGCPHPPCATLSPPPAASGVGGTQTTFSWQIDCNHIANNTTCTSVNSVYNFSLVFQDNFCPIPSYTSYNITIDVKASGVLTSPELKCSQVNPDGSVTLTWLQGIDPNGTWQGYSVYHSNTKLGTYTLLYTEANFNTLSYTHLGANAAVDSNYYYVTSLYSCVDAPRANIMAAMLLNVTDGANGTAILNWNPISNPPLTSTSTTYNIFREFPTGVWTNIGTSATNSYTDNISVCNRTVNYRVEVSDASGCNSVSSVDGKIFNDVFVPEVPILDSISVDLDSCYPFIGWSASTSPDAICYILYRNQGGIWTASDTVCNDSLFSNDYSINVCNQSECFRIAAIDSCGNVSPLGGIHCSINLVGAIDICDRSITLNWNPYDGWTEGVLNYVVYRNDNSAGYVPFATVTVPGVIDSTIIANHIYNYYVRAFQNATTAYTAGSNFQTFDAALPKAPDFGYIATATVESNGDAFISARIDQTAIVDHFVVERKTYVTVFDSIGSIDSLDFTGTDVVEYTDETAQTDLINYTYRIITKDTCQTPTDTTNIGTTIFLTAIGMPNRTNELTWTKYELWSGGVDRYAIFRRIEGLQTMSFEYLATVENDTAIDTFRYTDIIDTFTIGDGKFCYYILGYEAPGNFLGLMAHSKSNIACANQASNFYVPNTFSTVAWNPVNRIFKPVTLFVSREGYDLTIWDQWGQKVFRTKDIYEGWDGMIDGKEAPQDVYVYYCKYQTALGQKLDKRGTITLIK